MTKPSRAIKKGVWGGRLFSEILSGISNDNYSFTVGTKGTLTVKALPVVLQWSTGALEYTGSQLSVTATVKNAVNGDTVTPVITGKPGKVLDPKGSATRAEAAAMLQRYCGIMSGNN